jgi:hypothetical protein
MKPFWPGIGKRRSLIDWICIAACLAVFAAICYEGIYRNWSRNGIPEWYQSYLRWEKRVGLPDWWPL